MPDPRETAPKERIIFTAEADADHIEKNLRLTEEQLKQPKNAALYLSSVTAVYDAQAEPNRNWECVYRYSAGETLDAIATDIGVTRERVRQIINAAHTHISVPQLKVARRTVKEQEQEDLRHMVYEWSVHNPDRAGQECEEEFGVTRQQVKRILKGRAALHYSVEPRAQGDEQKEWQDQQLIDLLRQWWHECTDHRSMSFNDWSVARGGPTRQTPIIRFGKWSHALAAAGLGDERSRPRRRRGKYGEADLWAALVQFVSTPRQKYTYLEFEEYARSVPGMPSAVLVRKYLNKNWNTQVEIAKTIMRGNYESLPPEVIAAGVENIRRERNWEQEYARSKDNEQESVQVAVDALKQYIAHHGSRVVNARYDEWAHGQGLPLGVTLTKKSGLKWAELVQRAGGTCGTRAPRNLSPDEVQARNERALAGIREYLEHEAGTPTYDRYIAWAQQAGEEYPKGTALHSWFGGWRNALQQARKSSAGARTDTPAS